MTSHMRMFDAVHCGNYVARERRATGFSWFTEGGPFILPWRHEKWSVSSCLTCYSCFRSTSPTHYLRFSERFFHREVYILGHVNALDVLSLLVNFGIMVDLLYLYYGILTNLTQNLEAVDAKQIYPKEYITWREDPASFHVNGVYPLRKVWGTAREAWKEILLTPVRYFPCYHCVLYIAGKIIFVLNAMLSHLLLLGFFWLTICHTNHILFVCWKFGTPSLLLTENFGNTTCCYIDF